MGMSPPTVMAVLHVIQNELKERAPNPSILSLGYSDILISSDELESIYNLKGLEVRPDSEGIASFHGKDPKVLKVPTCESFFHKALGCSRYDVIDIKEWRGGEIVLDLNLPVEYQPNKDKLAQEGYDLVLDLGTLEHCFNAPQVLRSIDEQVKPGGYVIHWNPLIMPNHGFYNFSPTFFYDWYKHLGYQVESMVTWVKDMKTQQESGLLTPTTGRFSLPLENASNLVVVHKPLDYNVVEGMKKRNTSFPMQTKYRKMMEKDG